MRVTIPIFGHSIHLTLLLMVSMLVYEAPSVQAATLFQSVGIASSPNPVGSGARAMGMGGAFIGVADDATAASWNPAGLIQLERPEVSIVLDYSYRKEEFSSDRHPEIDNTDYIDDVNPNYFSVTLPFHFYRSMVVSINYQRLYDFNRSFDYRYDYTSEGLDLEQYKVFSQDGYLGALGLAAAIEITPKFSLGATLNIWTDQLWWKNEWRENFTESGMGRLGSVPITIDTQSHDRYYQFRGLNANLGLLWNITRNLTMGAVVKTPFTADLRHEFIYEQTQTFGGTPTVLPNIYQKEDVELDMPWSYGIGFSWRFSDAFSMDIDLYRTDWSEYILEDDQGNEFSPIDGRPSHLSNVEDTTQVRIGGEYLFISQKKNRAIPIRAGLFYDPEPSEGSPSDFYGFSVGSGIAFKGFIFDVAYQFRWGKDVDTGNLIATSEGDITQHTLFTSIVIHF